MRLCDSDGDLQIRIGTAFDSDDELSIGGGYISRAQVRELRDHLTGLLGEVTPAASASLLVEGQEYRLLPGATYARGSRVAPTADHDMVNVTRVRLASPQPDSDGDVRVIAVNGRASAAGDPWYVHARYLAPLTEATPAASAPTIEVGQEYRLLPDAQRANGRRTFEGRGTTRVRVAHDIDSDGDLSVRAVGGPTPGAYDYVLPRYLAPLTEATPAASIAQAARTIAAEAEGRKHYITARTFRDFANLLEGKSL